MKPAAAILLLLIFLSSTFYYVYYDAILFHSKEKANENIIIAENKNTLRVYKVSIEKERKYSDDEVWVDDKLYDVASRKTEKDSLSLYLYHDTDEQNILSVISNFFNPGNSSVDTPPGVPLLKTIHLFPNPQYTAERYGFSLTNGSHTHSKFYEYPLHFSSTIYEVIAPPPRLS